MSLSDKIKGAWNAIKSEFTGIETATETELTDLENEYLPAFHTFINSDLKLLGSQGISILKDEVEIIGKAFLNKEDVGAAIANSVPKVLAEVKSDVASDIAAAKNAVYTAVGLKLAQVANQ